MYYLLGDASGGTLVKVHGLLMLKGVSSAQVLLLIQGDHLTYLCSLFGGSMSIGEPCFKSLGQVVSDDLLNFQAAAGEECQKFAER